MSNCEERTMPICFTHAELKSLEEYAKQKGMLNCSQAIEDMLKNKWYLVSLLYLMYPVLGLDGMAKGSAIFDHFAISIFLCLCTAIIHNSWHHNDP